VVGELATQGRQLRRVGVLHQRPVRLGAHQSAQELPVPGGQAFDWLRGLAWPEGPWSLRTLRNASTERWANDLIGLRGSLLENQQALEQARHHADFDIAPVIAGEAADLVRERRSASAVVADLVQQAAQCLAQPPSTTL
jgi:hypothetical protein